MEAPRPAGSCGETPRVYGVSATYQGTLDPGAFPVTIPISTSPAAIHVWGGSAIQMIVKADSAATLGSPYQVEVGLKNVADVPVYNAEVQLLTSDAQGRFNYIYPTRPAIGLLDRCDPTR